MKKYNVYGIGHALVDREYHVSDAFLAQAGLAKGTMSLVDEDQQVRLLRLLADQSAQRSCGGSAANTMIGLAQFGGRAFHSCKVAKDATGAFFAQDMVANGVANRVLENAANQGVTGQCLVWITPDAERTMCTHLGVSESFSVQDLSEEHLCQAEYLYIEGYLVSSPSARAAAVAAADMARRHGVKIALTFSDVSMIEFFRDGLDAIIAEGVDLIFCNKNEALKFAKTDDIHQATAFLQKISASFGLTLGGEGAMVYNGRELFALPGIPVQAVDTNGAGDLFAGAFLYGITRGMAFAEAGKLACAAAAVLVTQYGARLRPEQARHILNDQE